MKRKGLGPSLMLKLVILIIAVGLVISGLVLAGVKEGSSFFPGPFGNLNFYLTGKIQPYNDEDSNRVFKGIWPFTNLYCDLKSEGAGFSDEVKQQCFGTHDFESCLTGACYPQDDSSIRISRIDQKNGKVIWGNAEGGVDVKVPRGVSDGERVGIACNQESCYVAQHYRDEVTFLYKIDKENRIITDLGDFGTSPGGGSFYVVANPYMKCDDSDVCDLVLTGFGKIYKIFPSDAPIPPSGVETTELRPSGQKIWEKRICPALAKSSTHCDENSCFMLCGNEVYEVKRSDFSHTKITEGIIGNEISCDDEQCHSLYGVKESGHGRPYFPAEVFIQSFSKDGGAATTTSLCSASSCTIKGANVAASCPPYTEVAKRPRDYPQCTLMFWIMDMFSENPGSLHLRCETLETSEGEKDLCYVAGFAEFQHPTAIPGSYNAWPMIVIMSPSEILEVIKLEDCGTNSVIAGVVDCPEAYYVRAFEVSDLGYFAAVSEKLVVLEKFGTGSFLGGLLGDGIL